jgi:2-keto-4-pentenoate hydratase
MKDLIVTTTSKLLLTSWCVLGFAVVASAAPATTSADQLAGDYLAKREAQPFPRKLSMSEALRIQHAFVRALEPTLGKPVGYKVGLVTREMQERFGMESPIRGVLLDKMLLENGAEIPTNLFVRPLFEADLIVVVKDKGINKAASVLDVAEHLKDLVAFIELPDVFVATNGLDGAMLTAANVSARFGVLGQRNPVLATPEFVRALERMTVTISDHTGEVLGRDQGKVILDQPLNAVLWLIEDLKKSGEKLKAGDMISLGSIKTIPVPAGKTAVVRYDGLPGGPLQVMARFR